jgi:hypothetical protein
LDKLRINGEWFAITQKEIDLVKNMCGTMGGTLVTEKVENEIETAIKGERTGLTGPKPGSERENNYTKKEFKTWMIRQEGKSRNTAAQYMSSIGVISNHYSQETNKPIDLYTTRDILFLKGLVKNYGIGGKYQDVGNNGHGTVRNAIAAYVRFLEYKEHQKGI